MKAYKILAAGLAAAMLLAGCGAREITPTQPASVPETTLQTTVPETAAPTAAQQEPSPQIGLADGVYTAEFVTDSSMFRANEACDGKGTLTVQDGQAILHVSLASKKILNLYPGTAAEAPDNEAGWLQPTTDTVTYSDGMRDEVFGFDIPVAAIGEDFDLALIGTKGVWYDHKVSVRNPVPADSGTETLADGSYTCEVTLQGGSGRAGVESPAKLTVQNGVITATVVWSSPNYEYMLIDGVQYDPVQTQGNSTFEISVTLDSDMAVSASTVAMSQPHLVDYILHFDGATVTGADE